MPVRPSIVIRSEKSITVNCWSRRYESDDGLLWTQEVRENHESWRVYQRQLALIDTQSGGLLSAERSKAKNSLPQNEYCRKQTHLPPAFVISLPLSDVKRIAATLTAGEIGYGEMNAYAEVRDKKRLLRV